MPKIVILFLALFVGANAYLFIRTAQALSLHGIGKIILGIVFAMLAFSYIAGHLLKNSLPFSLTVFLETIGSFWLFLMLYGLMAALLIDVIRVFNYIFHFFPQYFSTNGQNVRLITFFVSLFVIFLLYFIGYYRFLHPNTVQLSATSNCSKKANKTLNIVAISDLHLGYILRNQTLDRFVKLINEQKPDMVLIAGDIIDNDLNALIYMKMDKQLQQIKAPMGIYACIGNHDAFGDIEKSCQYLQAAGIHILRDSAVLVDSCLYIVGREDVSLHSDKPLSEILATVDRQYPVIVLDHQPSRLQESAKNEICLHLSGHTHGGQFFPVTLLTKAMYELHHGYSRKGSTQCFVSSGLGLWGPMARLGSSSEIVVIHLEL
ncbi:MAG: metallophosphoesterase [Bacteroidales bacterium]|jgi:predicted MPP superfamily phosphohydrolase|nr:metallophosphoesterase [Bacteroidales bacterium]